MTALDQRIVAEVRGPNPPQTADELIARLGKQKNHTLSRISVLLKDNIIGKSELPWRADEVGKKPKKSKGVLADIDSRLDAIANLGEKDRVAALKTLADIRMYGSESSAPPPPNDLDAMRIALVKMLQSAGLELCNAAIAQAFPSVIIQAEAHNATEAQTDLAGLANGRDNLD